MTSLSEGAVPVGRDRFLDAAYPPGRLTNSLISAVTCSFHTFRSLPAGTAGSPPIRKLRPVRGHDESCHKRML